MGEQEVEQDDRPLSALGRQAEKQPGGDGPRLDANRRWSMRGPTAGVNYVPAEPPFPVEEYAERMMRARAALAEAGLDACIVLGPETQFWLSSLDSFISGVLPQALVFSKDCDEPTLVVWDADVPLARATSWVDDIRGYRFGVDDPAAAVARVLREKAAEIIGFGGTSQAVSHATGTALAAALAPATLVDCTAALAAARMVKSPRELDCLRRAGRYAEEGLAAARRTARPGVT